MNPAYLAYRALSSGLFMLLLPSAGLYRMVSGGYRDAVDQRLGRYTARQTRALGGPPRIWLHAVSVGEVGVAEAVVEALRRCCPKAGIIVSTTTAHGQAFARETFGQDAVCIYAPVDFPASVRWALSAFRPDALVFLETELWPNWLIQARRMGIPTAVVNGRISVRSINGYKKIRGLLKAALTEVAAFSMIGDVDARRIQSLGAPARRVEVNGNAKYDSLIRRADLASREAMIRVFSLTAGQPVVVAGSIRKPEEAAVVESVARVVRRHPQAVCIIAPRHVDRAASILDRLRQRGISCQLRTALAPDRVRRSAQVVVLDTIGELSGAYSVATVAFCGGSLAPLGGQNVLEAAVWGRPVIYGPSMDDFQDAKELLDRCGGGLQVNHETELTDRLLYFISHPDQADAVGAKARSAVAAHAGAADKHAAVICRLLASRPVTRR